MKEKLLRCFKEKLSDLKSLDEYLPFALTVICVVSARFIESEWIVFLTYIVALAIYVWRRYDARIFVGTAMFLLVACAVILSLGYKHYANEVAIWAYYFLVVGVVGLLVDYLKSTREVKADI